MEEDKTVERNRTNRFFFGSGGCGFFSGGGLGVKFLFLVLSGQLRRFIFFFFFPFSLLSLLLL